MAKFEDFEILQQDFTAPIIRKINKINIITDKFHNLFYKQAMSKIEGIPRQAPATIKHININTIIPEEVLIPLIIINRNDINIKISIVIKNTK